MFPQLFSRETCCFPVDRSLSTLAGILWVPAISTTPRCIIVAVVGAAGNLLTLLSVPWAQRNKMTGFDRSPCRCGNHPP